MTSELSPHKVAATANVPLASNINRSFQASSSSLSPRSESSLHSAWNTTSLLPPSPSTSQHEQRNRNHHEQILQKQHHQPQTGNYYCNGETDENNNLKCGGDCRKAVESTVSILNAFDTIVMLSSTFICKICHGFMIDICLFPCGHMFCKFCGLSWLRLEPSCPVCHVETFRPFSSRCYEMESVIDEFYPLLYQFYLDLAATKDGRHFIKIMELPKVKDKDTPLHESGDSRTTMSASQIPSDSDSTSGIDCIESIRELRKQMNSNSSKAIHIYSPTDREKLRKMRRIISDRKDILLAAPCTSILQKLGTLGWGTSTDDQTISVGMRLIVWLFLCYSIWNFMYIFQHTFFEGGLRTAIYSAVFLIAFNKLQMQLFQNPEEAPDLFNLGLWENVNNNGANGDSPERENSSNNPTFSVPAHQQEEGNGSKSSSESFKDCEDGEKSNGQRELEQILLWKRDGKLNYEKLFNISNEMMEVFREIGGLQQQ